VEDKIFWAQQIGLSFQFGVKQWKSEGDSNEQHVKPAC